MAVVDETRYKSNSYKSKAEAEKKEVRKVVKGNVRRHEKTTSERIKEQLNIENFWDELLFGVLIPSAKEIFDVCITNTKDILLYGEVKEPAGRRTSSRRGAYVSYDGYSKRDPRRRDREAARRARFDFSDIEFDDLDDIDEVIDELKDVWTVYNEISVAQFYQAVGVEVRPTDSNWGWLDIRSFTTADTYKVKSPNPKTGEMEIKWILDLPRPKPLDY